MSNCKFYLSDLVINSMICINQKENRRIIDCIDLDNYKNVIENQLKYHNVSISFEEGDYSKFKKNISNYMIIRDDKFIMLPWIDKEELIGKFRDSFPEDICQFLSDISMFNSIEQRTDDKYQEFTIIEEEVADFYQEQVEDEIYELEGERSKCLQKLHLISKNRPIMKWTKK